MKALIKRVVADGIEFDALAFCCPGCAEVHGNSGLHILPVNAQGIKRASWDFDGNLEAPTLSPSILTHSKNAPNDKEKICHSFLSDSTHSMAGQKIAIPDLPDWVINEGKNNGVDGSPETSEGSTG